MQHKNKEVLFLRLLNQCLFHKPRSTNMRGEEIILPEGRKPFPEANNWAVTLHPTETGMIYKRENIHSLVIKTVASRLLSWVKKWRDTKVNESLELKAEDWKYLSFFRLCEKMTLPLPATSVLQFVCYSSAAKGCVTSDVCLSSSW